MAERNPTTIRPITTPTADDVARFWAKVDRRGPKECWPWTGPPDKNGYGRFWLGDWSPRSNRVAYCIANGDPGDLQTLHTCDNPPCCNPAHLYAGTPQRNMDDKHARGRARYVAPYRPCVGDNHWSRKFPERVKRGDDHNFRRHPECRPTGERSGARKHPERVARGERHGNALITADTVRAIRADYATGRFTYATLMGKYHMGKSQISGIVRRTRWKHVG